MSPLLNPASASAPAAHSACSCATVLSGALRVGCSNAPTMQALAWRELTENPPGWVHARSGQSRGRVCAGARMRQPFAARRVPCGTRSRGPSRNSLRSLRSLRSNNRDESDHEARCARGHEPCVPRRRICRCRRTPTHGFADALSCSTKRMPRSCRQGCGWAGPGANGRRRAAQPAKGYRDAAPAAARRRGCRAPSIGSDCAASCRPCEGEVRSRPWRASSAGDLGPQGRGAGGSAHGPAHPQPCALGVAKAFHRHHLSPCSPRSATHTPPSP